MTNARTITDIQKVYVFKKDLNYYIEKIRYHKIWKLVIVILIIIIIILTIELLFRLKIITL